MIIHTCDIGGVMSDFEIFKQWGLRVVQEFHDQFECEKADE